MDRNCFVLELEPNIVIPDKCNLEPKIPLNSCVLELGIAPLDPSLKISKSEPDFRAKDDGTTINNNQTPESTNVPVQPAAQAFQAMIHDTSLDSKEPNLPRIPNPSAPTAFSDKDGRRKFIYRVLSLVCLGFTFVELVIGLMVLRLVGNKPEIVPIFAMVFKGIKTIQSKVVAELAEFKLAFWFL